MKPILEIPERLQLERLLVRETVPAPADRFVEAFGVTGLLTTCAPVALAAALATHTGRDVLWHELVLVLSAAFALRLLVLLCGDRSAASSRAGDDHCGAAADRAVRNAAIVSVASLLPLWLEQGWAVLGWAIGATGFALSVRHASVPKRWQRMVHPLLDAMVPSAVLLGGFLALTGTLPPMAFILAGQLALLRLCVTAVQGLRDLRLDMKRGRATWMTVLGATGGRRALTAITLAPFMLGGLWALTAAWWLVVLPLLASPPACHLLAKVRSHEPGPIYTVLQKPAMVFNGAFITLLAIGLAVG